LLSIAGLLADRPGAPSDGGFDGVRARDAAHAGVRAVVVDLTGGVLTADTVMRMADRCTGFWLSATLLSRVAPGC
jgi:hypothetical protein